MQELKRAKTRAVYTARLVDRYSSEKNIRIIGKNLEALVESQLRISGFKIKGKHTRKHGKKEWTRTNHNLDFIAENEGGLAIGVEVKNTLGIAPPDEIDTKIDICAHLGIVPVFAVRWIKPYIDCIRRQGGFGWMFKTQMFLLGYEKFVGELYQRLSEPGKTDARGHKLEFPASVRTSLPSKPVFMFERWARHATHAPPSVNTTFRCSRPLIES